VEANFILGASLFCLGEFALAQDHLTQGLAFYEPQKDTSLVSGFTQNFKVSCLSWVASALWHLGYPDQALKRSQEALALAVGLSHPFSLAYALFWAAEIHRHRREVALARKRVEEVITVSAEQGFPFWLTVGTIEWGWVLAEQGQVPEGIAQMQQGLAAYQATGSELERTRFLALLAEAHAAGGQGEDGLRVLTEALDVVDRRGERDSEAELYRIKGELTLKQSVVQGPESEVQKEAEACFLKAIEVARKQQAKSLELRAVMSLSRLWQQQGKKEEARLMLAEIYGWFTEGFDTKDLQEAKTMLEELT
jgi:predicted ATPase